jgi:ribosomal protein S18 acetylase RimI-like enzyme
MSTANIEIFEVKTRRDLKEFIRLPYKIHKNHKEWLPPIYEDEWKLFDKNKNPAFDHCDTVLLLARKEGEVVGRIMGIINHVYNEMHQENDIRFCFLETYEDKAVFDRLIEAVELWGKEKGMDGIVGPIGFSDKDPQGFLISGFDDPMTVLITNHSFKYMVDFMEASGFTKKLDLVQYRLPIDQPLPEIYGKVADRVLTMGKYTVKEFSRTSQVKPYVLAVFSLINDTFKHLYGFAPLTDVEAHEFANRFLPILNANFIKLIFDEHEELVAFVIGMPDLSKGLRRSGGKLMPIGFIPVLWSMRRTRQLNLLLGAIKESCRGRGLDTVLAVKLFDSANKAGFNTMDTHLVLETNKPMRAEYERLNAEMYKKYRIYHRRLRRT